MSLDIFFIRLRESYQWIVYPWICFAKPWIRIVLWSQILTPKRFDWCLYKMNPDLFCILVHESWLGKICFESYITNPANVQKIQPVFTNLTNPHETSWILSTTAQNKSLKNGFANPETLRIQLCELENQDSQFRTLKIWFVDLFCRPVFKRFVLWIQFIRPKILKCLICIDSWGFMYVSRNLTFSALICLTFELK